MREKKDLSKLQYDLLVQWLKICCTIDDCHKVLSAETYEKFTSWCNAQGEGNFLSRKKFSSMLQDQGLILHKGSGGKRMIKGIIFLSKEEIMQNNKNMIPGYEMQDNYGVISPQDSRLWLELFIAASKKNRELCEVLQYIRNTGAKLVRNPKYGYIIKPVIGVYGWSSEQEYKRERKPLEKHRELLLKLLADLAKEANKK